MIAISTCKVHLAASFPDKELHKVTDRQTHRQTDTQTQRNTDRQVRFTNSAITLRTVTVASPFGHAIRNLNIALDNIYIHYLNFSENYFVILNKWVTRPLSSKQTSVK